MKTREEIDAIVMAHQEGISQQPEDTIEFVELLQEHRVKSMLQIGVATGQDAAIFMECVPGLKWLGIDSDPNAGKAIMDMGAELFIGSSRSAESILRVMKFVHDIGVAIDCLFIDGDHSFDGVIADYTHFAPAVNDGGLIAFHDINVLAWLQWSGEKQPEGMCHVPLLWDALKKTHGSVREIGRQNNGSIQISRTGRRREGIGIILKDEGRARVEWMP